MTADDTGDAPYPEGWHGINHVGLPSPLIEGLAFNAHPRPLSIHGTREALGNLFCQLNACPDQTHAAAIFEHAMQAIFDPGHCRPGYLALLRGWACDANSRHGAVLKGWVESRFGILPSYHACALGDFPSPAWLDYRQQQHTSPFHANSIHFQLDALYEYCQWSWRRFCSPARPSIRLWRGTNDCAAQCVAGTLQHRHGVLRLNNIVSFTDSAQRAEEFGDWVIEAKVPAVKIVCFPGLLRSNVLLSESEYLVLGGQYHVKLRHGL